MLRDFLFLNSTIVNQFLAQLEGGVYDEATQRSSESGKGGVGGGLKTPGVDARAEKSKESSFEDERQVRQTPESRFNRLYEHIRQDGLLVLEEIDDPEYLSTLPRGTLLELHDVQLKQSGFQVIGGMIKEFEGLTSLMDSLGIDTKMSQSDKEMMSGAAALDDEGKPLGIIATVPGDAKVQLALELDRGSVGQQVEGEASILVKLSKVLKRKETHLVADITGGLGKTMSRAERRKLTSGFKDAPAGLDLTKPEIGYPGAVATTVAIYR